MCVLSELEIAQITEIGGILNFRTEKLLSVHTSI